MSRRCPQGRVDANPENGFRGRQDQGRQPVFLKPAAMPLMVTKITSRKA
jgi:hypothetical protein